MSSSDVLKVVSDDSFLQTHIRKKHVEMYSLSLEGILHWLYKGREVFSIILAGYSHMVRG